MQKPFDDFIMVDWSASSSRNTGKDSIWVAHNGRRAINYPTRKECLDSMKSMLVSALNNNKRILCGFDFCFGLPHGAVEILKNKEGSNQHLEKWEWLWQYLDDNIKDDIGGKKNKNNRWDVASDMNYHLSGENGPFWGFQGKNKPDYLEPKQPKTEGSKKDRFFICGNKKFKELRQTEQSEEKKKMFSVWQLSGAGSVGSQSLLGMAYLNHLRLCEELKGHVKIHPFENCDSAPIVFAESYYGRSDMPIDTTISPKDKGQVMAAVEWCRTLQDDGRLGDWLSRPADPRIYKDEGWTFTEPKPKGMKTLPQEPFEVTAKSPEILTPDEIYANSFAIIKEETGITGDSLADKIRRRMIHACGDTAIADDIIIHGTIISSTGDITDNPTIITDSALCSAALLKKHLPTRHRLICAIEQVGEAIPPSAKIPTRSAVAMEAVASHIKDAIIVIGNAPTALQRLLAGITHEGWDTPRLLIATPVGFIGAVESKQALCDSNPPFPYITLQGRKGGSAIAAAALNAILLHKNGVSHG